MFCTSRISLIFLLLLRESAVDSQQLSYQYLPSYYPSYHYDSYQYRSYQYPSPSNEQPAYNAYSWGYQPAYPVQSSSYYQPSHGQYSQQSYQPFYSSYQPNPSSSYYPSYPSARAHAQPTYEVPSGDVTGLGIKWADILNHPSTQGR